MKKKLKSSKKSKSAEPETVMPDLVTAMTKLVERLETLERKMDIVLGRVSNIPNDIRNAVQNIQRPTQNQNQHQQNQPFRHSDHGPVNNHAADRRERMMYKAVCAECGNSCEVPFKPTGERATYCKECFAIRKAGQGIQQKAGHGNVQPQRNFQSNQQPFNSRAAAAAVVNTKAASRTKALAGKQKSKKKK